MLAQFCESPRKALEVEDEVVTTIFDGKSAFIAVCLRFGTAAMIWNTITHFGIIGERELGPVEVSCPSGMLEAWRIVMATLSSPHGRTGFGGVGHVASTHVLVYSLQYLLGCVQHSKYIQACEKSRFSTGQSCFLLVRFERIKTCDPMMGVYQQGRSVDLNFFALQGDGPRSTESLSRFKAGTSPSKTG
nr:hypothetical protein CFP56_37108 [Quercus suber]